MSEAKICQSGQMIVDGKCKPLTKQRLEQAIEKRGIRNLEITWHKRKYHVLHILKNNVPVPLFITDDKKELKAYLNLHYKLNI